MGIPYPVPLALNEGKLHEKVPTNKSSAPAGKITEAESIQIENEHQSRYPKIIFEFPLSE